MVQGRNMTNYDPNEILDLNTSFERYFSKLPENQKINDIGPTELKLWPFKDALFNARYNNNNFLPA